MAEALWSLIGVFIGFLLSEGTQWLKIRFEQRGLHSAMTAELQSIVRMIPSKIDILVQARGHFANARLMPTTSTHFPNQIYWRLISSSPELVTTETRDCLHVLYERLRIIDESMDSLENRFNSIAATHSTGQAVEATTGSVGDLTEALQTCRMLAQSVLDNKPINVYQLQGGAQPSIPPDVPAAASGRQVRG
jgi:hypothetical protein